MQIKTRLDAFIRQIKLNQIKNHSYISYIKQHKLKSGMAKNEGNSAMW